MVDEYLLRICKKQGGVVLDTDVKGTSRFLKISRNDNKDIKFDVQYVNDAIYCIYFLDSQFFDIPQDVLYKIVEAILKGNYQVIIKGIFRKHKVVAVKVGEKVILPERSSV